MAFAWKPNWQETQRHFLDWWRHEGLVLGMWGAPHGLTVNEIVEDPGVLARSEEAYLNPILRARMAHHWLANCAFPADCLPLAFTDIGPGSLSLYLGSEPGFAPDTVWFNPTMHDVDDPEKLPPLRFDPENKWWKITEATAREMVALGQGKYMVGFPDLVENVDILSALREPQTFMMDLIERPEWVQEKVSEINRAYFDIYQRLYDIIKLEDGSSAYGAFCIWGPGKTAKVQCDASAMFSPAMFEEFVVPALREQCAWLDHSMYHLDGTQCIGHLDHLLAIEELDAIEWTPQAGIERGGSPRWYPMYRRILAAGKSVQVLEIEPDEIIPLLDEIGGNGVYLMTAFQDEAQAEQILAQVEAYR